MLIELKLCLHPDALAKLSAQDIAGLTGGLDLPCAHEAVRVTVEFARGQAEPQTFLLGNPLGERRALVVVSPKLVDATDDGCRASQLAQQLLETSWQRQVVLGLVGVTTLSADKAIGLDGVVSPERIKEDLKSVFQVLVRRIWFKITPPALPAKRRRARPNLVVRPVKDPQTFRECLALRHVVYSSLGYLDPQIAESQIKLDLDCYDTHSDQFVVVDRDANRVAGTARLISPGVTLAQPRLEAPPPYDAWCRGFANEEPGNVYRKLLQRRLMASLPIVDSFRYFKDINGHEKYAFPRDACEISRVVVHPDYRGHGILRMLMQRAIDVARSHRKRYLLLECAPFHEAMYKKFGFVTIENDGQCHYTRAQRLDSWAVAMHLDLDEGDQPHAGPNPFRLAIDDDAGKTLEVTIADPDLDDYDIEQRLREPFSPSDERRYVPSGVAKAGSAPLLAYLRLAFGHPDKALCDVLRELNARLPNASILLASAGQELPIANPACASDAECRALLDELNGWLEGPHAAV